METIKELIEACGKITKEKGFNTDWTIAQLLLVATEINEAFECLSAYNIPDEMILILAKFRSLCYNIEEYRTKSMSLEGKGYYELSHIETDKISNFIEELADIVIRVFSYVGANNLTNDFICSLKKKVEINKRRPYKHNKNF